MGGSQTPSDHKITPRDRRFSREAQQARWWMDGDPFSTALFNTISANLPKVEMFLVEAIKQHSDGLPHPLTAEMRGFVRQEAAHAREHAMLNRKMVRAGYDTAALDRNVSEFLSSLRSKNGLANLAAGMSLEHFAALLSQQLLKHPEILGGMDAETAALWRWHAIEEIEHKAVMYDLWLHCTRDWSRWRRWAFRVGVKARVNMLFWPHVIRCMLALLAQDEIVGLRARMRCLWCMYGRPGILRRTLPGWLAFFFPGFHPWKRDDRALIRLADREDDHAGLASAKS